MFDPSNKSVIYKESEIPFIASDLGKSCKINIPQNVYNLNMSLVMRKQVFGICENKDADQLRGNREADQRLCFRYLASTIPLLPKSKIARL